MHSSIGFLGSDSSSLVLQRYCQKHSLLQMTYFRAQFSAQRFSACTWTIYPKSSSLVTSNLSLMTLRCISRLRQNTLIDVYAKLLRISNTLQSSVTQTSFWLILTKPSLSYLGWGNVSPKLPSNIGVPFLGQDLVPVTFAKDLGVTLDSNLTFNYQIASLTSSLLPTLVQINRVRQLISKDVLHIILNSLVFSNCSIAPLYDRELPKKTNP